MKFFSLLFLCISICCSVAAQAPANDECTGAIDLGIIPFCSSPAQYTNVNATASNISATANIPSCFTSGGVSRDVWFTFTTPADGSILDATIRVLGNIDGNGTLQNPQVAIYRGECLFEQLDELDCASAPNGENEIALDLFGLTPGFTYFLRINDYSATATPNAGTFRLCVEKYVPVINIGTVPGSQGCTGTLFDTGGETGDYSSNEDLTFTICPQEFHQCIVLNVVSYDFETNLDFLQFYQGDNTSGILVTQISGVGTNFEVQVSTLDCATIRFSSDGSVENAGFEITWACQSGPCTSPPLTTCAEPDVIPSLPYSGNDLSNCFSGNTINSDPCGSGFLEGNDYVFAYTSPGGECIRVATELQPTAAGVGVYDQCPTLPTANCIAANGSTFLNPNPYISSAFLENPGTYYIVFSNNGNCTQFNIAIDTVTCPVLLPPASTCDNALNISGCSNTLPEIIALNPGSGDPDFIQLGVNDGCFLAPQSNYAFFYFIAGADGKFGFTVNSADPNEASDIDINVWGPIPSVDDICDFTSQNQPIRSTWSGGDIATGLQDIHPLTGINVTDDFDCGGLNMPGANGDDFVRRIDVQEGEIYVILLDDYGQLIENGGIAINFNGTTNQVLSPEDNPVTLSADTSICLGQSATLIATGGEAYFWAPATGLDCAFCDTVVASPIITTNYTVQIVTTCNIIQKDVVVKIFDLDLGPDVVVCNNASFQLNPNGFTGVQYSWSGGPGLSCTDCPTPTLSGLTTGLYNYYVTMTTPLCTLYDTLKVAVVNGQQPQYNIPDDINICAGESINIGGNVVTGTTYIWTSNPSGFTSNDPNPLATPSLTTTYYLEAGNSSCPVDALDSVKVTVFPIPQIQTITDTIICQGTPVLLGNTLLEPGVNYQWSLSTGALTDPTIPNPIATPDVTTTYTLTASNQQCVSTSSFTITVIPIFVSLNVADTVRICKGTTINLQAAVSPAGTPLVWSPTAGLQISPNNLSATTTPIETILYTITASVPGCTRTDAVYIQVDSLPENLDIMPADTMVCYGSKVLLTSQIYEPAEYQYMDFSWTPFQGQLTPDSLYNMLVSPTETTIYQRITHNGACSDTAFAVVNVIPLATMTVVPADTTICPGQPVQLLVTYTENITDIMWTPSVGLSCTDCDNPVATVTATTTFNVEGTFEGCKTNASGTVNVRLQPGFRFPDDKALCAGESVLLNSINDPTTTYSWTSTDPNFVPTSNPQPTTTPTQTTTYTLNADNGCPVQASFTVTVTDAQLTVSPDVTVCKNVPVQLTATGSAAGTYLWSTGANTQSINVEPAVTTTYTVVYTYGDGCTKTDDVIVTINGEAVVVELPIQTSICPGESVTLNNAGVPAGATYAWTANPPDPTLGTSAGNPTVQPTQTTTYSVVATQGSCTTTATVTITIPTATLTVSPNITVCVDEQVTLTATGATSAANGSYNWTPGGQNTPSISFTAASTGNYTVNYNYGNGCVLTAQVGVTVVPSFDLTIKATPAGPSIGLGAPLELIGVVEPATNVQNYQFQWSTNGTNSSTGQIFNTIVSTNDTSIFYRVIATSPAGCTNTAEIRFSVEQPLIVWPNAFTPDGDDDVNAAFRPVVIAGAIQAEEFAIFNRWGQKVFSTSEKVTITKDAQMAGWDGTVDGKQAPVDTYIYQFTWRRSDGALQPSVVGEVTLLR